MDISGLLGKGGEAAERRNYDYAIALYRQACKLDPDNVQARRELRAVEIRVAKEKPPGFMGKAKLMSKLGMAHSMLAAKKYDAAIESAEDALQIDPGSMSAQMIVGRALSAAGHANGAVSTFEDICASKGGGDKKAYAEALRELARGYEAVGKIAESMQRWEELRRAAPEDREAVQKIRDLSAQTMTTKMAEATSGGQRGSAARSFIKSGKEAERLERDAQELRTEDDVKAAIKDAQDDIAKRPDDARLYGKLGDLYKRLENYDEAKKAYQSASEKDPANPQWKIVKLDDLEIWKKTRDVNELAKKAKAGDAAAGAQRQKMLLELLDYKMKSFIEREKQYSTDSRIKQELGGVLFQLAEVRKDKNLYDESIKRFQFTFKDPKFRHEAGLKMGLAFSRKGQHDLALKRFDETLASLELKDARWKELTFAKADTLEARGHDQDALKCFLEIYEIDVAFKDVAQRVERLQKKLGGSAAD